ncbi:hypothetical protein AK88_03492 [Plasmodium fragile]|uniref:Uncharacterized protein n=1 Tax=Plasmodium fragile TaxID=5857 RepID=A0A0D9QIM1_PLAFR|nr:uncharacterized protein AK88_03492 [Plasmodium fragile]KJP86879.1 hypothetical protein AK88_03492 [Plasmodium fragile]
MENYESPSEVLKNKEKIKAENDGKEKKDKLKFIDIFNDSNEAEHTDDTVGNFLKKKKITESKRKAKNKSMYILEDAPNVYATDLVPSNFASSSVAANSGTPDGEKNILGMNTIQGSRSVFNNLNIFSNEEEQNHAYLVNEIYRLKAEVEEEKQKGCRTNEEAKILKEQNDVLSKSISDMKNEMEKLQNIYNEEVVKIKESYERRLLVFQVELEEKENYCKKQKEAHREEFESQLEEYKSMYHNEKRKSQDRERLIEEATVEREKLAKEATIEREKIINEAAMEREKITKEAAMERDKITKEAAVQLEELQNRVAQMTEREKDLTHSLNEEKEKNEKIKTEAEKYKQQILSLNEIINKKNENIKNMVNDILLVKNVYDELAKEKELNELAKKKLVKKIETYENDLHYLKKNMEGYRVNNDKLRKCNQEMNEHVRKMECQIRSLENENEFLKKENLLFNKKFLNVKKGKQIGQLDYLSDSTHVKDEVPSADSSVEGNNSLVSRRDEVQEKEVMLMGQTNEISKVNDGSGESSTDGDKGEKKGAASHGRSGNDSDTDSDDYGEDVEGASSTGEDRPVESTCALSVLTTGRGKGKDVTEHKRSSINGTTRRDMGSNEEDALNESNYSDEAEEPHLSTLSQAGNKPNCACSSKKEVHLSDVRQRIGNLVNAKNLKGNNAIGPNYEEDENAGSFNLITNFLENGTKDAKKKKKKKEKNKCDYNKTKFSNTTSVGNSNMFNKELSSNRYLFDLNLYSLKRYNIFSFSNGLFPKEEGAHDLTNLVRKKRSCPAPMSHLDGEKNFDVQNVHMSANNTWRSRTEVLPRALRDFSWRRTNGGEEVDSVEAATGARILQGEVNCINHTNDDMEKNKTINYFLANIKKEKKNSNDIVMKRRETRLEKLLSRQDSSNKSPQMGKEKVVRKFLGGEAPIEYEKNDRHASGMHSGDVSTADEFEQRRQHHFRGGQKDMQSYLLSKCKGKKNNIYGLFIINERLKSIYKNIANKRKSISNFPLSVPKIESQKQFSSSFNIIQGGKFLPEGVENAPVMFHLGCKKNAHEMVPNFEHNTESNEVHVAIQNRRMKGDVPSGDETNKMIFTPECRLTEETRSGGSSFVVSGEDHVRMDEEQIRKNILLENSKNMNRSGKKGEPTYTHEDNDEEGIFFKKKSYLRNAPSISVMFDKNQPQTGGYLSSNESHSRVATNWGEADVLVVDGEKPRSMEWHPLYQEGMEKCVSFAKVGRHLLQEGEGKVGSGRRGEGLPLQQRLTHHDGPFHYENEPRDNEIANHLKVNEGPPKGNPRQTNKWEEQEEAVNNKFNLNDVFNSNFNNFLLSYKSKKTEFAVSPSSVPSSSPSRNRIFEILKKKNSPYDHSHERNCTEGAREDSYFENYLNGLKQQRGRARVGKDNTSDMYVRRVDRQDQQNRSTDKHTQRGSNKWDCLDETEKFIKQDSPKKSNVVDDQNIFMQNNDHSGIMFEGGNECRGDSNRGNIKKESERFLFNSNSIMNTGSNLIQGTTYENVVRSHIENAHFINLVKNKRHKDILSGGGQSNSDLRLTNQEYNTSNRSDVLSWRKSP